MRPIAKIQPGETVQYKDSRGIIIEHIVQREYVDYRIAKMPLVGCFDRYCVYCEGIQEVDALEVDHCIARHNGGSKTAWGNYLLCCKLCNTVKSAKEVDDNCHFPNHHNTFMDFVYDETGRVFVNPKLPEKSKIKAQNLYNLLRLGRDDADATPRDFRWQRRYESWNKAIDAKTKYEEGKWSEDDVIGKAKDTGHWSIWFTVFAGVDKILSRLILDFAGTCQSCFDPDNHYQPVPRNPQNIDDPI